MNLDFQIFTVVSGEIGVISRKQVKCKVFIAHPKSDIAIKFLENNQQHSQDCIQNIPDMLTPNTPTFVALSIEPQQSSPKIENPTVQTLTLPAATIELPVAATLIEGPVVLANIQLPVSPLRQNATLAATLPPKELVLKDASNVHEVLNIATYNLHTLLDNRILELTSGCKEQGINIVAVQEHRWTTTEEVDTYWTNDRKWVLIYTSAIGGHGGIGILVEKHITHNIIDFHKISHRILQADFDGNPKLTYFSVHAPHGGYSFEARAAFYNELTAAIQAVPTHNITIVGGDLNAQLGKDNRNLNLGHTFYYDTTNSNGMLLTELCSATNMISAQTHFNHPKSKLWTHQRPNGSLEQLDHILINGKWCNSITNCRAYSTVEINSDHRILSATLKLSLQAHHRKEGTSKRNWEVLRLEDKADDFNKRFKATYNSLLQTKGAAISPLQGNPQTRYDAYVEAISTTADEALPKLPRKQKMALVSNETDDTRKKRNEAKSRYAKTKNAENKKTLSSLNLELRNQYKQDVIQGLEIDLKALQEADKQGDSRTTWTIVNKISGNNNEDSKQLGCMTKKDGTYIPPSEEGHEWMKYFETLLGSTEIHVSEEYIPTPAPTNLPIETGPFTKEEIEKAIRQAKTHKAPGIDKVTAEVLKLGGEEATKAIHEICNLVLQTRSAPHQWKESILNPIHKKGSRKLMNNYRGISLMSVAAKLFNRLLLNRVRPVVDPLLRDNQAGFRTDRSCIDQIHILRRIIEGAEIYNLPLIITYVDFKKAFDSVNRKMMFAILRHYGVPGDIVAAIKCIYDKSMSCVRNKGELSEFFEVTTGVMQGDVLAPYIFIIVIDFIINKAAKKHGFTTHPRRSTRVPEQVLNELAFADDIANLASSIPRAQQQLNDLSREAQAVGLHINDEKTEYTTYNVTDPIPLELDGIPLKTNNNFRYLGAQMKDSMADITKRRGQALAAFWKMKRLWDNDTIPIHLKMKVFKVSVLSIFLYACETWVIGERELRIINSVATKCYRYILHVNQEQDHVSNDDLYATLKEEALIKEVRKRQLKKLGHYLRKPAHSLVNTYALYTPTHGARQAGARKKDFKAYLSHTINSQVPPTEPEIRQSASDRDTWRGVVKQAAQK